MYCYQMWLLSLSWKIKSRWNFQNLVDINGVNFYNYKSPKTARILLSYFETYHMTYFQIVWIFKCKYRCMTATSFFKTQTRLLLYHNSLTILSYLLSSSGRTRGQMQNLQGVVHMVGPEIWKFYNLIGKNITFGASMYYWTDHI